MRVATVVLGLTTLLTGCKPSDNTTASPSRADARAAPAVSVAAGGATDAASAADAAVTAGFTEGEHHYVGLLGERTSIRMQLTRAGRAVSGSYSYESVGRSIALDGTVDDAGVIALTERANAKVTGKLRLVATGPALDGTWSDPAGKKSFRLRLGVSTPPTPKSVLNEKGERCLAALDCSADEAARLFIASDDAHEADAPCYRFADGAGVPRDLARARACLERLLSKVGCRESSADLTITELAIMRIDGVGGKQDIAAARASFADCFDDVTRHAVLAHADAKERDPKTPAKNFCKDDGGTTLVYTDCQARARDAEQTKSKLRAKVVAAGLDDEGRRLLAESAKAYDAYALARAGYVYQVFVDGSIRHTMFLGAHLTLSARRTKDLETFWSFKAREVSADDVTRAERATEKALEAARATANNATEKDDLKKSQDAWTAYRDADLALYAYAFGAVQGADKVRATRLVDLEKIRARECAAPSLEGK